MWIECYYRPPHTVHASRKTACYHGPMHDLSSALPVAPGSLKIIACAVLKDEVLRVAPPDVEIEFIDGLLHNYPDRMRATLQEHISATPGERTILLCCGRCSNGSAGVQAGPHRLVLPAVDDCVAILLGSRARYLSEFAAQPGTFYYTRGWIEQLEDPYREYLKLVPKYGAERAAEIARLILENYTRLAVIDTGTYPLDKYRDYLDTVRRFYDLPLQVLTGSLRLLDKLMNGPHDEEFIVVEPGETLDEDRFWALSAGD